MAHLQYLPGDPRLVDQLVYELKSKGIFDQFRKECIADVDTRPAYQNLRQRVENSVSSFLSRQTWKPDMNKNQLREKLRKHILDGNYLEQGVERIVDQVVNPKVASVFIPQVEELVCEYLGIARKKSNIAAETSSEKPSIEDLLPTDLEAVSPGSVHDEKEDIIVDNEEVKMEVDIDESKPELKESSNTTVDVDKTEDTQLSGISELTIHDANSVDKSLIPLPAEEIKPENIPPPENSPPKDSPQKGDVELENIELPKEPNLSTDIPLPDEITAIPKDQNFKPMLLNSEEEESSSDSSLIRNMSPLTPIRNFNNENSCDAQQAFENTSVESKEEEKVEPSSFRFTIEAKSSENSSGSIKIENKNSEQASLQFPFKNVINVNTFNTPMYEDSSNSNNLQIDYESDANSKVNVEFKPPDSTDHISEDSKKEQIQDDKKNSHKSSHRSRDSHRHSSSKDRSSRHSSSRDKKDSSFKQDKKLEKDDLSRTKSTHQEQSRDRSEKRDSRDSSKHRSSHKGSTNKDKESKSYKSSSSSQKHPIKSEDKKSSSSKEKDKNSSKDKDRNSDKEKDKNSYKEKTQEKDKSSERSRSSKDSKSHHSDKDKKSGSKSKHEEKDKKEKKVTDDHYSASGRGNHHRRSTDRDSNDGSSSSKGSHNPSSSKSNNSNNNSAANKGSGSKLENTSNSGGSSSPSDKDILMNESKNVKDLHANRVVRVDNCLETPLCTQPRLPIMPDIVLKKPRFAANLDEAKKMMKLRKYLDEEQTKMNQEAALLLEFQANVRPNLSQVYSSISGPELEFACMTDDKFEKSNVEETTETSVNLQFNVTDGQNEIENIEANKIDFIDEQPSVPERTEEEKLQENLGVDISIQNDVSQNADINIMEEINTYQMVIVATKNHSIEVCETSSNNLLFFSEEEKFNADIERLKFSKFFKSFMDSKTATKKMYLLNCDAYEEDIMKEVSQSHGNFEIVNYFKNGHLTMTTTRNIVKNVSLSDEINLPLNVTNSLITESLQNEETFETYSFEFSSDYDEKLEEAISKTSRQQIMEIILGGGITESPTKMPKIDYCINPNLEVEDNLKNTEIQNSMKRCYVAVESLENDNMDDVTPNKLRKINECNQISSTTLEMDDSTHVDIITPARSKYLGKARRVGLSKPKKPNVQNSPSSDKSIENYEQNTPEPPPPNGKIKSTPRTKVQQRYSSTDLYKPKLHYLSRRNNIS